MAPKGRITQFILFPEKSKKVANGPNYTPSYIVCLEPHPGFKCDANLEPLLKFDIVNFHVFMISI